MQSRYIYFVKLFLIYFKWFQIYSIERTKRTSIYSTQEVVILSRKPETHFIVLVCWLCDLIYKILSSFTETIFSAVPIANKWVFVKKRNKAGEVIRYKARLVVKGCAQRPGYDYMETFSPVVRMDTLRAILALVAEEGLKMQQMDVKGAYLNGTLQETIYMRQPEGCEDGTDRVCRLIKSLYGLKQAGREWNNELDRKLKIHGYEHLFADPCAYIRRNAGNFGILTVWVDDSLLFASSESTMNHMKDTLRSEWDVTDLGEPNKIVGIEVTRSENSLSISQTRYIENVLHNERMNDANPVRMPMDPHIQLVPNPDD